MVPSPETILIIDDEEVVCESLTEYLTEKGYRVISALSGREGLALLREHKAALVLLDKNLPDMNWTSVTRGIWDIDYRTRVVMITGYPSRESLMEAMNMGISHYLEKPFDLNRMTHVITRALSHYYLRRSCEETQKAMGESTDRLKEFIDKLGDGPAPGKNKPLPN